MLVQQESDGSSFPNGGIRNTFEARGYSAWDPSSPVFVVDDTLCIPTVFIAYTGESLDYKAPLLKALRAVNKAALDVMHYFDPSVKKIISYLDGNKNTSWLTKACMLPVRLAADRPYPDGTRSFQEPTAGRPLLRSHTKPCSCLYERFGNQSLELGIPVKTRHNEVAPNQFELAPIYEECNLAVDHNMLVMSLMRKVARNHGFRVLLHEKTVQRCQRFR